MSLAIVFPAVLTMVLLVVQASLWWYAAQVALSAAREGADAGRVQGGSADLASWRAADFVRRFGTLAQLQEAKGAKSTKAVPPATESFRMTVTVRPLSLLPVIHLPDISRSVEAPVEKFVAPGQQP
ncbi:TadE family protein [Kitasatospora sp. NPDC002227]|uniref:TadE family protein n=1 Tax=Kitasatospora sp. NPDC002227 TaxID=3154773 RepID=UPI0033194799